MIALSLRLLVAGGRRAATAVGLVGAAVAVGTALLAITLGALHGWDAREARTGWRTGGLAGAAAADPVALVRVHADSAAGQPVQVVDLATVRPDAAPPPGLPRMPAPGEVWVSPALAALMQRLPADELAQRFPGPPTGFVDATGLRDPGELVAVVGRAGPLADARPVASFGLTGTSEVEIYRQLTYVALALVVVPILGLLGASARLTAARRAERLATLRLLGASTRQVTVIAVAEVTVVAAAAAVAGVALEWLVAPALATIPLGGSGWYATDLMPTPGVALLVVAGVAVLAAGAALGGMRRVVVGPLGVLRRQEPGSARWLRVLGVVAGVAVFLAANIALRNAAAAVAGAVLAVGVLAVFATVSLIGPLVVRLVGRAMTARAASVPGLLAGRRLLDDPRAAFRPLAGLTMAVFVAGFLAPLTSLVGAQPAADDTSLRVRDVSVARVTETLAAARIPATVTPDGSGVDVVPGPGTDRDRVRTALAPAVDGAAVLSEAERSGQDVTLVADIGRGTTIVLVGTFLAAATSTGTAAAARVLDQRRTLRLLRLSGTPLGVLDAARRAETVRPLAVCGGIALALGLFCAAPFAAASAALMPSGLVVLGVVLVGGIALVLAASAASRPLLRAVTEVRDAD